LRLRPPHLDAQTANQASRKGVVLELLRAGQPPPVRLAHLKTVSLSGARRSRRLTDYHRAKIVPRSRGGRPRRAIRDIRLVALHGKALTTHPHQNLPSARAYSWPFLGVHGSRPDRERSADTEFHGSHVWRTRAGRATGGIAPRHRLAGGAPVLRSRAVRHRSSGQFAWQLMAAALAEQHVGLPQGAHSAEKLAGAAVGEAAQAITSSLA